jgi:hypothetical protein
MIVNKQIRTKNLGLKEFLARRKRKDDENRNRGQASDTGNQKVQPDGTERNAASELSESPEGDQRPET